MKTVQISLNSIDKVKSFVNDITKFDYDFDLVSGRYVIDAKSIMGIFKAILNLINILRICTNKKFTMYDIYMVFLYIYDTRGINHKNTMCSHKSVFMVSYSAPI